MIRLTYFTPTYNRANLLPQLYQSLVSQTNKNFIWLIIDDGSTDNTKQVVDAWIDENKISIKYVYKENGGKNTAIDLANQLCETEFICCVDSDDYLSNDCTEVLYSYFNQLDREDVVGLVGRRAHYNGKPMNDNWGRKGELIYFYDINSKFGFTAETILVFKTNIIKHYHFPSIPDERFITESAFYKQFMYAYKMVLMTECVYLSEYQEEGYTSQGLNLFFKNPKGAYYSYLVNANYDQKYSNSFKEKVISMAIVCSWEKLFKLNNLFKDEFKFNLFYKLCGKLGMLLVYPRLKKKYKRFLTNNDKNAKY